VTDATEVAGGMIDPVTEEIIDQKELAERLLAQAWARARAGVAVASLPVSGSPVRCDGQHSSSSGRAAGRSSASNVAAG
jgi:hypothetical protein